jgi:hypothetical protein
MGRSGTSAVTRTLVTSGFFAGAETDLMAANVANPVGFWENLSVFHANEEILARIGGTWFLPPTIEAQRATRSLTTPQLRNLVRRLMVEAGGRPLAVKDPRIGVLLEIWGPLIDELLHPVLVVRNPVEIALSLATRDGTPTAFTLASWERHTTGVLHFLNDRPVTVVPYARLVGAPETASEFVADVAALIRTECAARVDPGAAPLAIEPPLHREHAHAPDAADHLTCRQADLWRFLDSLPPGNQVLDVPLEILRPTSAAEALTRCEIHRQRQHQDLEELRTQVAGYESRLLEFERAKDDADARAGQERAHAESERARADAADYWLAEIQASASWRLTAPARAVLRALRRALTLVRAA